MSQASDPRGQMAQPAQPALRIYRAEDLLQKELPRRDGPFTVRKGEILAVCLDISLEQYRESGELWLFADKKFALGSLGYHRQYGCANLHGVTFNRAGRRTLDVTKAGNWWTSVQVTVE